MGNSSNRDNCIKVGHVVRQIRRKKNLTEDWLASRLGISQNSISKMERNIMDVPFDEVPKICSILEVTIKEFFEQYIQDINEQNFHNSPNSGNYNHYDQSVESIKEIFNYLLEQERIIHKENLENLKASYQILEKEKNRTIKALEQQLMQAKNENAELRKQK